MTKNMEDLLWRGDSLDRELDTLAFISGTLLQACPTSLRRSAQSLSSTARQHETSTFKR
jgi:hypothetical protein